MRIKLSPLNSSLILAVVTTVACADDGPAKPTLVTQESGTTARLQAISVVSDSVAWASGLLGTVARTTNGGLTWTSSTVPGADSLQFRDVDAIDADTAYILSSGSGSMSRIYKTTDAGVSWELLLVNPDSAGFLDCMGFWDSSHGAAYGDAVDGSLVILYTTDGQSWARVATAGLPGALPGEGGFAASGTCLVTHGDSTGWIGTGASSTARVLETTDRGRTWNAYSTPVASGSGTSGITTLGFSDELLGMAAGGDISIRETQTDRVAVTSDGGHNWVLAGSPAMPGAIYGISYVAGAATPTVVAVGPGGADYSLDNGATWMRLDSLEYWSVDFSDNGVGWAVGPAGRITKITFHLPSSVNEVN